MSRYANAAAFKQALENRLRSTSATGVDFARRRQLLVFHRFLARIVDVFGDSATLKGGLVVELRVERARTTKDIDLRLVGSPTDLLANLDRAGRLELGDFLLFKVAPDAEHPQITNEGMAYECQRYRIVAELAGKPYGQPFGLDVAFADPMLGDERQKRRVSITRHSPGCGAVLELSVRSRKDRSAAQVEDRLHFLLKNPNRCPQQGGEWASLPGATARRRHQTA